MFSFPRADNNRVKNPSVSVLVDTTPIMGQVVDGH